MPEQYRDKRGSGFTLSRADQAGYFLRAQCSLCRVKRVYRPIDLVKLVGDIGMLEIERRIRCEKCREKRFMDVSFWYPTGAERAGLKIRRLVGIRTVRKAIWRDEEG